VDEPTSRWYGLGGSWIVVGLPTYNIQDCCDRRSGIMLQLCVVQSCNADVEDTDDLNLGTNKLMDLVKPWWIKTWYIISADSHFSSVQQFWLASQKDYNSLGLQKLQPSHAP
jgi:hypothetical protein